jgi:flagellar hook-length control protein FliK
MKVDDARTPSGESSQTSETKAPSSSSFSEVLEQKTEAEQKKKKNERWARLPSDEAFFGLPAMPSPGQIQPGMISQPPAAGRSEVADIQALVQEIVVMSKPAGQHSIEIQFNSKTLDGLHVQISGEQNQIAIRLSAASPSVSKLLSRNLDQLSEALQGKGLQVASIQVEIAPAMLNSGRSSVSRRSEGQKQHEQGQQRQQR